MRFPWQKKPNHFHSSLVEDKATSLYCKVYSISDTGPTRTGNEDSITWMHPANNKQVLFAMVADGMGGHNAGEIASSLACSAAEHFVQSGIMRHNIPAMLHGLFQQMHAAIINAANSNSDYYGMGTTGAAVFIEQNQLFWGHVGDSRIYQFNKDRLQQLTTDQTLVNKMISEGKLKRGDAETGTMKHLLLQALGTAEKIKPEIAGPITIQPGDYFFICSDGIHDVFSHDEIEALMCMERPALVMECIKALCYERKALDNFSAIIIEVLPYQSLSVNSITREQNVML